MSQVMSGLDSMETRTSSSDLGQDCFSGDGVRDGEAGVDGSTAIVQCGDGVVTKRVGAPPERDLEWSLRRRELRKLNLAVKAGETQRPSEMELRKLDSSLKRCTGFVRKIRTGITEETKESLMAELESLNLSRYISELVTAVGEGKYRVADADAAIVVLSRIHQLYAEFAEGAMQMLMRVVVGSPSLATRPEGGSRRAAIRVMAGLALLGLDDGVILVQNVVRELTRQSENRDSSLINLSIVASFAKAYCNEFLDSATAQHLETTWEMEVIASQVKSNLTSILTTYYNHVIRWLSSSHEDLRHAEWDNIQAMQSRGEVSEEAATEFDRLKKAYERLSSSVHSLAEALGRTVPEMPEPDRTTRLTRSEVRGSAAAAAAANVSGDRQVPIFESEEERSFYEDLPDVSNVQPTIEPPQGISDEAAEIEENGKEKDDDSKGNRTLQGEKLRNKQRASSYSNVAVDTVLGRLSSCDTKALADELATTLAELGNRGLSRRIAKVLFNAPTQKLNLLPFFGRLVATLDQIYSDLGNCLLRMLEEEFRNFVSHKDVDEKLLAVRVRNACFLGELVKFRICPHPLFFELLNLVLLDFTHNNVDVACHLLETCGRVLYRSPQSAVRAGNMLDTLWRLKSVKNLAARHNAMIENAYFACRPPEKISSRPRNRRPPMLEYLRSKIYGDMTASAVEQTTRLIRRLPWDVEVEEFLVNKILKVEKMKYSTLHLTAPLIMGISKYRESFSVAIVDGLLESIRTGLEESDQRYSQRRVAEVRLLGEMYNSKGVTSASIFETLFMLITLGHDPSYPVVAKDPNEDYFRARLVCVLLDTCSRSLRGSNVRRYLEVFLSYFERYLFSKAAYGRTGGKLPREVEFMVSDTIDKVGRGRKRAETLEDAVEEVAKIESSPMMSSLIRMPRYRVGDPSGGTPAQDIRDEVSGSEIGGAVEDSDEDGESADPEGAASEIGRGGNDYLEDSELGPEDESDVDGDNHAGADAVAGDLVGSESVIHQNGLQVESDDPDEDEADDDDGDDEDESDYSHADHDDEDDEEEDDDDDEDDEDVGLVPTRARTEEEKELDDALSEIMQESIVSARSNSSAPALRMALPMGMLLGSSPSSVTAVGGGAKSGATDGGAIKVGGLLGDGKGELESVEKGGLEGRGNLKEDDGGGQPASTKAFKFLVRKGGKNQTRDLAIPVESSIVTAARESENSERAELQDIKRLVLTKAGSVEDPDDERDERVPAASRAPQRREKKERNDAELLAELFRPRR